MRKKPLISFVLLLTFWIVLSEMIDLQHVIVGILLSLLTIWFWKDLKPRLPSVLYPRELLLFGHCIIMLIGYVIKSNIDVAKTLFFGDLSEASIFLELDPGIKSDWGRVFLATCITITPGTVTVDVNPETNIFTVHALTVETGKSLYYWSIISEIKNLETIIQRRQAHEMDISGVHDSNSISTTESHHRTDGN